MVEHLASVPESETLINSLGELGVIAPAATSPAPSSLQLDTFKLPSSLTALAAPLASAVARVEALTATEVEQDAWLHDTIVNFAVIAQQFLDASRALQVTAATTCVASCIAGEACGQGTAPAAGVCADGPDGEDMRQVRGARTRSTADAYESSVAGSSDGSVAEGSVSVNHNGFGEPDDADGQSPCVDKQSDGACRREAGLSVGEADAAVEPAAAGAVGEEVGQVRTERAGSALAECAGHDAATAAWQAAEESVVSHASLRSRVTDDAADGVPGADSGVADASVASEADAIADTVGSGVDAVDSVAEPVATEAGLMGSDVAHGCPDVGESATPEVEPEDAGGQAEEDVHSGGASATRGCRRDAYCGGAVV